MRKLLFIFILLVLAACNKEKSTSALEGVWVSNRALTVSNFRENDSLTEKHQKFLMNHLGKMRVSFRGNQSRVFFEDIKESEVNAIQFEVLVSNQDYIDLEMSQSIFESNTVRHHWVGDCYYLNIEGYGYKEYFCPINNQKLKK